MLLRCSDLGARTADEELNRQAPYEVGGATGDRRFSKPRQVMRHTVAQANNRHSDDITTTTDVP